MKKPVLILAITALTTFVMGWVAHRVYKNSQAISQLDHAADSIRKNIPLSLPVKKDSTAAVADSSLFHQTSFEPSKKDSVDTKKSDSLILQSNSGSAEPDESKKRFTTSHSFDDFKVGQMYKGAFARKLNFSTCRSGQLYKSQTKNSFDKGINFGGRYAFTRISCGSDCYSSTITDVKTGKVYAGPHAVNGYKFRADSKMLLVNPPDKDGFYTSCEVCDPEIYIWTGRGFKKLPSP